MGQATRTNFFVAWNQTHFLFVHSSVRPAGHDKGLLWAQHVASCLERLWLFLRAPWMLCLWRCHSEHTKTRQRSVTFSQYCQFIALAFSSKTKITWYQMQTLWSPLSCSVAKKEDAVWQYSFSYQQINEHRITDIWLLLDKCDCDKVLYT